MHGSACKLFQAGVPQLLKIACKPISCWLSLRTFYRRFAVLKPSDQQPWIQSWSKRCYAVSGQIHTSLSWHAKHTHLQVLISITSLRLNYKSCVKFCLQASYTLKPLTTASRFSDSCRSQECKLRWQDSIRRSTTSCSPAWRSCRSRWDHWKERRGQLQWVLWCLIRRSFGAGIGGCR